MIDNDAEMCLIGMPLVIGTPLAVAYFSGEFYELTQSPFVTFLFGTLVGVWLSFLAATSTEIERRYRQAKKAWKYGTSRKDR